EGRLAVDDRLQEASRHVEGADLDPAFSAGFGDGGKRRLAGGRGAEAEDGVEGAVGRERRLDLRRHLGGIHAGRKDGGIAEPFGEALTAQVERDVADLLVDADGFRAAEFLELLASRLARV